MEQLQLGEYALPRDVQQILRRLRTSQALLWFPDDDQRVFVRWTPRPQDRPDSDSQTAPWVKSVATAPGEQRLTTAQVVDRLRAPSDVYRYELVTPPRCPACNRPVWDSHALDSAHLSGAFCSPECLHETEFHLGEPLTPTHTSTAFTHPLQHVQWDARGATRADADRPRWST
jgi:hypothetical protein